MCYKCLLSLAEDSTGDGTQKKATAVSNAKNFRNDPMYKAVIQEFEAQKARKFTMHPKLDRLKTFLVQHFGGRLADAADEAEAPEETRAMVFVTFRECVEEIVEALDFERPMLRAAAFIGQGTDKEGKKGLAQKDQLEVCISTVPRRLCPNTQILAHQEIQSRRIQRFSSDFHWRRRVGHRRSGPDHLLRCSEDTHSDGRSLCIPWDCF